MKVYKSIKKIGNRQLHRSLLKPDQITFRFGL